MATLPRARWPSMRAAAPAARSSGQVLPATARTAPDSSRPARVPDLGSRRDRHAAEMALAVAHGGALGPL